jgi:hypothetical protein
MRDALDAPGGGLHVVEGDGVGLHSDSPWRLLYATNRNREIQRTFALAQGERLNWAMRPTPTAPICTET